MVRTRRLVEQAELIAAGLVTDGICVAPDALAPELVHELALEARALWSDDAYRVAQIGSGESRHIAPNIRSDRILWLDELGSTPAQREFIAELEHLRLAINRAAMLGLFEWEGHLACYPPGASYRRHLDVFAHARERRVSTVLYLNEEWSPGDGGELRIWTEPAGPDWRLESPTVDVEPRAGTLVTFLSEDTYHEVLPAHVDRFSLTGWFRTRGSAVV